MAWALPNWLGWMIGSVRHTLCVGRTSAPSLDQLLIGLADGPDIAIQIVQAEWIHAAVLFTQSRIPIDLIRQRVPGEADDRNAAVPDPQDVGPFLPQPGGRLITVGTLCQVRLGVHDRKAIAVVVLPRDLCVSEHFARRPGPPVGARPDARS